MKIMKRVVSIFLMLAICLVMLPIFSVQASSTVNIMSYNLKNTNYSFVKVTSMVKSASADVVGMQEVTTLQYAGMTAAMKLSGYNVVKGKARGTNSWTEGNEYNPIYYKSSKLSVYASGTFWLSDTPTKESKFSDSSYKRICTWACFQIKGTNDYFLMFNTHLDFSDATKVKQINVILNQAIAKEAHYIKTKNRMVITGDLNAKSNTTVCKYLQGDAKFNGSANTITKTRFDDAPQIAKKVIKNNSGNLYTQPSSNPSGDIDHIYITSAGFTCNSYQVISNAAGSDHLPIVAKLTFK